MLTTRDSSVDTIYAVSTAGAKAAVAVVRVSGPATERILLQLCRRRKFEDRHATLTRIFDGQGNFLDRALVTKFVNPRSFTGEDMVEFHVTGGRAVISGLLRALGTFEGVRPAEAGEFARRAFENGKIDLAEVEGLASVVEAETSAQLRHALTMAGGEVSRRFEQVRTLLLGAMVHLEAMLDFSDVEDANDAKIEDALPSIRDAAATLQKMLQDSGVSERLRNGMTVVIAGRPNVGKSSLLNYLAGRDVAIVSAISGTTRDVIEVTAELGGFPVIFVDTAGIRQPLDPIEAEGIARGNHRREQADLVLWLSDEYETSPPNESVKRHTLIVRTKVDIVANDPSRERLAISAKTGQGVNDLIAAIIAFANEHFAGAGQITAGTDRQRFAAGEAYVALDRILTEPDRPIEMIAEDLRVAVRAVGRISGRIEVEEVLGAVFARLCVGK